MPKACFAWFALQILCLDNKIHLFLASTVPWLAQLGEHGSAEQEVEGSNRDRKNNPGL